MMVYKVNGDLYAPDLRGVNAVIMAGGGIFFEPNGKKLDELPADAVMLTDTEVKAQAGLAEPEAKAEAPETETKPKKRGRPKANAQ